MLLQPRAVMACRITNFPSLVLEESDCKGFKFMQTDTFFITLFPETDRYEGSMHVAFCRHTFSNFVAVILEIMIAGKQISFFCGEQAFEAACVMMHLNFSDHKKNTHNLQILKNVLTASNPTAAKSAPVGKTGLKGFMSKKWDANSFKIMEGIQLQKMKDPAFCAFVKGLAQLAKDNGIASKYVRFYEAAEDPLWGTSIDIDELWAKVYTEGSATTTPGKNLLGKAIGNAFVKFAGKDYQCLYEETDKLVERIALQDETFSMFKLEEEEPAAKRAKTTIDDA